MAEFLQDTASPPGHISTQDKHNRKDQNGQGSKRKFNQFLEYIG